MAYEPPKPEKRRPALPQAPNNGVVNIDEPVNREGPINGDGFVNREATRNSEGTRNRVKSKARTSDFEPPSSYTPPTIRGGSLLGTVLANTIGHMNSAAQIRESLALAYWAQVAGPQGAAASRAEHVRDGTLFVRTRSSVWSHELTLYKARILENLNKMIGGNIIKDIRFRAQGLEEKQTPEEEKDPTREELEAVVLHPAERAELRGRINALYSIRDEHARMAITTRLTLDTKLRHWRIERGWRVCPNCSAVHKTDYEICPICRLCGKTNFV